MRYLCVIYCKKPSGKYNEVIEVCDRIRSRTMSSASVILDYEKQEIVKCRLAEDFNHIRDDFQNMSNFYKQFYPDLIGKFEEKYELLREIDKMGDEILTELLKDKAEEEKTEIDNDQEQIL